jgi:molybdopterin biosynthesis enzyme MoaB
MSSKEYDAVLVLGGGIGLDGSLPDATKAQFQKAVDVFNEASAHAFITSGLYG